MRWFKQLFSRRRRYHELHESIREHLEEKIEDLIEDGMSRENAEQTARRQFGNVTLIEERSREVWQWPRWESFLADLKYAVRQLFRNPGFTVTVIFTLALSIGANTAIFSIVNALMLKSLPYPHPERMGTIYTRVSGVSSRDARHKLMYEQWQLLRDEVPALLSAVSGARDFWRQPAGRVSCAISPGGTYFGPLSRCAGHSTRPGAQLLRCGGPPPRAKRSHIELQLVAKYFRRRSQYSGASRAAERRTLHRDRRARPRGRSRL